MSGESDARPRRAFVVLISIAAGILAFATRTLLVGKVFQDGVPVIPPFDDVYHWKRIAYSAANFPTVLEFDANRGLRGAFCPWPPLYDLGAAAIARLAGATERLDVLRVIVWIPPIATSLLTAVTIAIVGRLAPIAAALLAVPLACAPFLVFASSVGNVDHHFTEPFLVLAMIGATLLLLLASSARQAALGAAALAVSIAVALFIQTALILSAGLSFLCIFAFARRRELLAAGAVSFVIAAAAVGLYRVTRPPAFPDGPWFLGYTHAALLVAAATALLLVAFLDRGGKRSAAAAGLSLLAAALVTGAAPGAADSVAGGLTFLGGDPWLSSIDEFQPVWKPFDRLMNYAGALGAGAIASLALVVRSFRRHPADFMIGVFAISYIGVTLPNRRFSVVSTALAALATAVLVERLWRSAPSGVDRRSVVTIALILLIVIIPPLHLALWWTSGLPFGRWAQAGDFLRIATLLRERGGTGRVLAPWWFGHMFNVIGERPVVIDNFGTMADPHAFQLAHATTLMTDERDVAAFCDRFDVRYLVLETPLRGIPRAVLFLGLPMESFVREASLTTHAQATWYWRVFFEGPKAVSRFRRIAGDQDIIVLERVPETGAARAFGQSVVVSTPSSRSLSPLRHSWSSPLRSETLTTTSWSCFWCSG